MNVLRGEKMDKTLQIGSSSVQHGKLSDRVYLMKLAQGEQHAIIDILDQMASEHNYSKVVAKVKDHAFSDFVEAGFKKEASIPLKNENLHFVSKFFDSDRELPHKEETVKDVINKSKKVEPITVVDLSDTSFTCERMSEKDAEEMAELYKEVFATYPFPIFDTKYLVDTMQSHVIYFGIRDKGRLVALASAETDSFYKIVEMTDFATSPDYRGMGLATYLLNHMEKTIQGLGYETLFTIARSLSYGMNITFAKMGYNYSGTLVNNTNISGGMESMNVWYKAI
jgi:putative beta-lysine N-acetyltransferase